LTIDDDFFTLGGDSILAIRVIASLKQHDYPVTIRDLFTSKTVGVLAELIDGAADEKELAPTDPVAVPPSPVLEMLRESGQDVNSWFYSESITVPDGTSATTLQNQLHTLATTVEALRLRVSPTSRRLWTSEILPAPRPISIVELSASSSEQSILSATAQKLDFTDGVSVSAAVHGETVTLVAHAAAMDRRQLHQLVSQLGAHSEEITSGDSLLKTLQELESRGADMAETAAERAKLLAAELTAAPRASEDYFTPGENSQVSTSLELSGILTALEQVLGTGVMVHLDAGPGPVTAVAPYALGTHRDSVTARDYPVLRHYTKAGRRALKKIPLPDVLVTTLPDGPGEVRTVLCPQGPETLYRGVVRITGETDPECRRSVTLLGFSTDVTRSLSVLIT
ncbi:MAG: phosphopantetheine-binding protein, partial [Corynebacterium sp.]